jgi:hypothetical protein
MKIIDKGNFFTIAEREVSGMAGVSIEYLCLSRGEEKNYLLSIAGYEAIANISEYYNEKIDDYEIPDVVNGKKVHGVVDDYIVGGVIWLNINDDGVEFDLPTDHDVLLWLNKHNWQKITNKSEVIPTTENILASVKEALQ